jgi:hypothetical protein
MENVSTSPLSEVWGGGGEGGMFPYYSPAVVTPPPPLPPLPRVAAVEDEPVTTPVDQVVPIQEGPQPQMHPLWPWSLDTTIAIALCVLLVVNAILLGSLIGIQKESNVLMRAFIMSVGRKI